ncbi:M56 family metallopeptidase [Nocardia sp. NPDC006630]|uniref:M56 family metallopeptidase n=1 Tax=Nocardia sp. NPDC006630 TaxID=3157181 RepID=UPI0033BB43CD
MGVDPTPRIDDGAIGTGTTMRFILLVVLLVSATAAMFSTVTNDLVGGMSDRCLLSAGADLDQARASMFFLEVHNQSGLRQVCEDQFPDVAWWLSVVWVAVVVFVSAGLFFGSPVWKSRRRRVVQLAAVDPDGRLHRRLAGLVAAARLTSAPRFVVDLAAGPAGAVVFGRNGRPTVCLQGGLLAERDTDPHRFRAVVLHELAHIRNRDVTITYLTITLWRVFLVFVLTPFAVYAVFALTHGGSYWRTDLTDHTGFLIQAAFLAALVYLARADVLRHREICADRTAVRLGADPRGWVIEPAELIINSPRRVLLSFLELWRTHPRWQLRRDALTDPAPLFGAPLLTSFLAGAVARLTSAQFASYAAAIRPSADPVSLHESFGLVVAAFIAGTAGIALSRSVIYAQLTTTRIPSGFAAGLCLGIGFVAADLLPADGEWLPEKPWILALLLCSGVIFGMWSAAGTALWISTLPTRAVRVSTLLTLVPAGLMMAGWLAWWDINHVWFEDGLTSHISVYLNQATISGHRAEQRIAEDAVQYLYEPGMIPLFPYAAAAVWAVPAVAWTVRRHRGTQLPAAPGIDSRARRASAPTVREVLRPIAIGTVTCWTGIVIVQGYMHTFQPRLPSDREGYAWIYLGWVLVALLAGAAAAAVAVNVYSDRFRLVTTIVVTETVLMFGGLGFEALSSLDGCIPPLSTFLMSCGVQLFEPRLIRFFIPAILAAGLAVASLVAVAATMIDEIRTRLRRPRAPAHHGTSINPLERWWVAVIVTAAVVTVVANELAASGTRPSYDPAFWAATSGPTLRPISLRTRGYQLVSWGAVGGFDLIIRFFPYEGNQRSAPLSDLLTGCRVLAHISDDAAHSFRLPDPQLLPLWSAFITGAASASKECIDAVNSLQVPFTSEDSQQAEEIDRNGALEHALESLDYVDNAFIAFGVCLNLVLFDSGLTDPVPATRQPRHAPVPVGVVHPTR